ncbi:MAG TPA: sigma factor-like helix-turn-helix DNA-binding protein [Pseudobacteroides sp.]|uniref:RNA polymerase sigma factor n=1 Tax=Pseudobacteroides sp. TaxID=1968840 RepID=UPI002F928AA3
MKFKKTPSNKRGTYTYYGVNGKVTVRPGKDGITEVDIKLLHSLDDNEVYTNIKNSRPKMDKQEKAAVKEWEEAHPGEVAPKNWNISIDASDGEDGTSQDKSKVLEEAYYSLEKEVSPAVERLRDVVETLTKEQQELYQMVVIQSMTLTEAAEVLGTSIPNIHKRINRIYEQIKKKF